MPLHPGREILYHPAIPSDLGDIEYFVRPALLRRDDWDPSGGINLAPELVTVISAVGENDLASYVLEHIQRRENLTFIAGPEQKEYRFSASVDADMKFRVPASLGLSKAPVHSGLRMAACVLVNLDMSGVDHLERTCILFGSMNGQQLVKDPFVSPAQVESINAVPFSISLRKLVPDTAGNQDPPDPIQSFSKIGGRHTFFQNVRFNPPRVKLIVLGLRRAGLAWRHPNMFSSGIHTSID